MMQNDIKNKRILVALTGGYASGKTTVLACFERRGYLVVSADNEYARLIKDARFVEKISNAFGILPIKTDDGIAIDKEKIKKIVFSDAEKLRVLNEITHNSIYEQMFKKLEKSGSLKAVFEIPLLFESKKDGEFDFVVVVLRDKNERIKYGAKRDNISEFDATLRIKNQFDYDKNAINEHTLIYNDSTIEDLMVRADEVIDAIEKQAN